MSRGLKPRLWLQHRRINHRYRRARIISLVGGTLLTLMAWAGYSGRFRPWGDPKPLAEVWWILPVSAAFIFLVLLLWPFRDEYDDWPTQR
jgi:ABC-type transport system involved in cytochrome c biogenesis permease subunit